MVSGEGCGGAALCDEKPGGEERDADSDGEHWPVMVTEETEVTETFSPQSKQRKQRIRNVSPYLC